MLPENSKTVLIVDDSAVTRKIIRHDLEKSGYSILEASDGNQALALVAATPTPPDLVTLDVEMPVLNGFDTCKKLREQQYRQFFTNCADGLVPVIFITARDTVEIRETGFKLGAIDFIPKPFEPGDIHRAVDRILQPPKDVKDFTTLIVDDNPVVLKILEQILKRNGYTVFKANNGEKALQIIEENGSSIDLVITDYVMPKMRGDKFCRILRQEYKLEQLPIIFLSAVSEKKMIMEMFHAGATDYVMKPFFEGELIARIKVHLQNKELIRTLGIKTTELAKLNTELHKKNKILAEMAIKDGLTGIYNHRFIIENLNLEAEKAKRYNHDLTVLMADVDFFKKVNDQYGHPFGDHVLVIISKFFKENLREVDLVGRYGGEEFMIILPHLNLSGGLQVCQRLIDKIRDMTWEHDGLAITVSGGLAAYDHRESPMNLIARADAQLYKAKENGRNRIEYKEIAK